MRSMAEFIGLWYLEAHERMSDFKFIASANVDAASNTSLTSAIAIPGNFSHFAVEVPQAMGITATCQIRVLGAQTIAGTFREVVYSNNPATSTSGNARAGEISASSVLSGAFVINEALMFAPFVKFQFSSTATANTALQVYGRKFD